MNDTVIGIDLAKRQHQLHGENKNGKVILKKRVDREDLVIELAKFSPALVGMEACGGAHYWARQIQSLGHKVRLMAPQNFSRGAESFWPRASQTDGTDEAGVGTTGWIHPRS